jgi:hypothetical protein
MSPPSNLYQIVIAMLIQDNLVSSIPANRGVYLSEVPIPDNFSTYEYLRSVLMTKDNITNPNTITKITYKNKKYLRETLRKKATEVAYTMLLAGRYTGSEIARALGLAYSNVNSIYQKLTNRDPSKVFFKRGRKKVLTDDILSLFKSYVERDGNCYKPIKQMKEEFEMEINSYYGVTISFAAITYYKNLTSKRILNFSRKRLPKNFIPEPTESIELETRCDYIRKFVSQSEKSLFT